MIVKKLLTVLGNPFGQAGGPELVAAVASEPDARDAMVARDAAPALRPYPRFRQSPSRGQFSCVNQFDAGSGRWGHHWDTSQFCAHVFNPLQVYCGSANRYSCCLAGPTDDLLPALPLAIDGRTELGRPPLGCVL